MTKRTQLANYIVSFKEIADIMTAMKNLSLIEINKIAKFMPNQEKIVETFAESGMDFLEFNPQLSPQAQEMVPKIYVLLGSERGFCGDFNENVCTLSKSVMKDSDLRGVKLILVGHKLVTKFAGDPRIIKVIPGANCAAEIPDVIFALTTFLNGMLADDADRSILISWNIIYNEIFENKVQAKSLSPLLELSKDKYKKSFAFAPELNQRPKEFFAKFLDEYFFATLTHIFYQSLMAENNQRLHHMDGAITRLEKKCEQLKNQLNLLRQEEITEEIEIILLSSNF